MTRGTKNNSAKAKGSRTSKGKKQDSQSVYAQRKARAKGARRLGDLLGEALTPVCRKQGFASSDILRHWGAIVGPAYADCSEPERIRWPRGGEDSHFRPGTLVLRCEGAQSVYLQHEQGTIIERVNAYFGYAAIEKIQILQRPLAPRKDNKPTPLRALSAAESSDLDHKLDGIKDDKMAAALHRLGHAIMVSDR